MKYLALFGLASLMAVVSPGLTASQEHFTHIIDSPSAIMLPRAAYSANLRLISDGGFLGSLDIGLADFVMVGFSYGGQQVIGRGTPDWNPNVEFSVRARMVPESETVPGVAVGYSSRAYGRYSAEDKMYETRSKGFYAVITKCCILFPNWELTGGANVSVEGNRNLTSAFVGADVRLGMNFAIMAEFDLPLEETMGREFPDLENGNLNAGLKWIFAERLAVNLFLKNVTGNRNFSSRFTEEDEDPGLVRELSLAFVDRF
jgi:hypothetical protein